MKAMSADEERFARNRGVIPERIEELWEAHCKRCEERQTTPGSFQWRSFVNSVIERENADAKGRVALDEAAREAERRRADEKARKAAEDKAYAKEAFPFGKYLDSLLEKPEEQMTDAERWLVLAGSPAKGESPGTFLMRVFSPAGKAELVRRAEADGEELPGDTWMSNGKRVFGCRCPRCAAQLQRLRLEQARRTGT